MSDDAAKTPPVDTNLLNQLEELRRDDQYRPTRQEIEMATAIVLLEVASSSEFRTNQHERMLVHQGLKALFGSSDQEIKETMGQARNSLASLRGSSSCAALLNDYMDPGAKRFLAKLIDDLIKLDGKVGDLEVFLRNKFRMLLGVPEAGSPIKS